MRSIITLLLLVLAASSYAAEPEKVTKPFHQMECLGTDNGGNFRLYKLAGGGKLVTSEIDLSNRVLTAKLWIEADGSSSLQYEERHFVQNPDTAKEFFNYAALTRESKSCWMRFDKGGQIVSSVSMGADDDLIKEAVATKTLLLTKVLPALEEAKTDGFTLDP